MSFQRALGVIVGALSIVVANAGALSRQCDPPVDAVLSDLSGEQVQPKVIGTSDGGAFVSWYDNSAGGYDVRLQRVDDQWNEALAHQGMLIADRSFSSTQDYDLAVDGSDFALLAFRDDRFGGTKVTAQRVGSNGSTPWGAGGVQFGNGTDFVAVPKIAATWDGQIVVAWTNEADIHLQRLDAAGNVLWSNDTVLTDANGDTLSLADLEATLDGDVIVSWVQAAGFSSPKHLYAQRIDVDGNVVWGNNLAVFDGGSLQFGNFPPFVKDGSGGAVFAWYDTAGQALQCYVQHVDADGNELFTHNGVAVSTLGGQERVSPAAAYDANADAIYVFWMEERNAQSERGVYGQKLDMSGARQWSDHGVEVRPLSGSTDYRSIGASFSGGSAMVCFIESAGFGDDRVRAAGLDASGNLTWNPNVVSVTGGGAERSRLVSAALSAPRHVALVWQDGNPADIHAQTIRTNTGTLGSVRVDLAILGTCPGNMQFKAYDSTPGGRVAFAYARGVGQFVIPNNMPCGGTALCLNNTVQLGAIVTANGSGVATLTTRVPGAACGGRILVQAIDLSTCSTSRAAAVP